MSAGPSSPAPTLSSEAVGPPLPRAKQPWRIAVVGAGMAGMSAALELSRAGHEVTVLEARTRAGGRVYTLREPLAPGLHAEAGALFIPDTHHYTLHYARAFGLKLAPVPFTPHATSFFVRGTRLGMMDRAQWPLQLTPDERRLGVMGTLMRCTQAAVRELGDPRGAGWPAPTLAGYDAMSIEDFLRQQQLSGDMRAMLGASFLNLLGEGIGSVSALFLLRDMAMLALARGAETYLLPGGSDQLSHRFVLELGERLRLGAAVVSMEQTAQEVRVMYEQGGTRRQLTADFVLCAVPFAVLGDVEFVPALSPERARAIRELPYTAVTRIWLQTRRRFWPHANQGETVWTDLPIKWVREVSFHQPGERGLLEVYTTGDAAREAAALDEPARVQWALDHLRHLYPELRGHFEAGTSYSWQTDGWARGAYAWFRPGQMTGVLHAFAAPEGRIHFAGEHLSNWPSWMQGAFESGLRAARRIHEAN